MKSQTLPQHITRFAIFALVATAILFFISPDSYTHELFGRCDSANFFMCGKAWMSGMTPYVDFTDSKGPLLWLIYGCGYLLSHYDYTGVFWLSCLCYVVIYQYTYKTTRLFIDDERLAFLATILMSLAYFCPLWHYETRAEDFCLLFVVPSLYHTCRVLYGSNPADARVLRNASFVLGLSFGATLMIKFTIAAMLGVFVLYVWFSAVTLRYGWWRSVGWMGVGALLPIAPFVILFSVQGNLADFVSQYFLITFQTVQEIRTTDSFVHDLAFKLMSNATVLLLLFTAVLVPLFVPYMRRFRLFPLVSLCVFLLIVIQNARWPYYFSICSPFMLFSVVALVKMFEAYGRSAVHTVNGVVVLLTVIGSVLLNYDYYYYSTHSMGFMNLFTQSDNAERRAYHHYADAIAQKPHPTIIYLDSQCNPEFGVPAGALPGCRDWSQQTGATQAMKQATRQAVVSKRADFVVATEPESVAMLSRLGYKMIKRDHLDTPYYLFAR